MKTWDIFCRVIDNYGDIGVCWRLARQLANEQPLHVRLWVDDITALMHIWPAATNCEKQWLEKVEVCIWSEPFDVTTVTADAVVEAFACHLPDTYLAAMVMQKKAGNAPQWFNLEYLSAESWVEDCHGLISVHPQNGLRKVFFFPGFSAKTGGLLCEKSLLATRNAFLHTPDIAANWLAQFNIERPVNSLLISLFAYENNALGALLDAWQQSSTSIISLVPEGKVLTSINTHWGVSLTAGQQLQRGNLLLKVIPFLNQLDYDRLLWACDINFVRGEDSFVRAQWAAKPMVWHIYPQDEETHILKLQAFLAHYTAGMEPTLTLAVRALWHGWNRGEDCTGHWQLVAGQQQSWREHSQRWAEHLNSLGDLASNMVHFSQKTL